MTSTAYRVHEALVCDDAFTADLGGHGAWADILIDEVPLATAFSAVAARVGSPPNLVEALVCPDETAARLDPGGDTRTADQRRADALVDLCSAALGDPRLVKAHGQRPTIHVTVAASTLMGLDQQPADLDGYGPSPPPRPGASPPTPPPPGGACSPTTTASFSTPARKRTGHPRTSPAPSSPETSTAGSPAAAQTPPTTIWTTSTPTTKATTPPPQTHRPMASRPRPDHLDRPPRTQRPPVPEPTTHPPHHDHHNHQDRFERGQLRPGRYGGNVQSRNA